MVFIVCYLASQLSCSGGHYVEALGLSAAGELGWDVFLWWLVLRRVSKLHWDISCGLLLNGCSWRLLCGYGISPACLGGPLFCGNAVIP